MTAAAVPILREHPYTAEWHKKALASGYDPRNVPISEKECVTIGMSMTEKQVRMRICASFIYLLDNWMLYRADLMYEPTLQSQHLRIPVHLVRGLVIASLVTR
jgi:hypothetical protein